MCSSAADARCMSRNKRGSQEIDAVLCNWRVAGDEQILESEGREGNQKQCMRMYECQSVFSRGIPEDLICRVMLASKRPIV